VDGLLNGNTVVGIKKVSGSRVREALKKINSTFRAVANEAKGLVKLSPDLNQINEAAGQLEEKGGALFDGVSRLDSSLQQHNRVNQRWTTAGFVLSGLALLSFLMLVRSILKNTRDQLAVSKETNDRNQRAILTLLDEMATLADGDLTVKATVTEDITGAIADSMNYAIEAMRSLVGTINEASTKVAETSKSARDNTLRLSESSEKQARKIVSASESITDLTHSIDKVSKNAEVSAGVAEQSLDFAQNGVETVRRAIDGMENIRENIHDTSKRIKRLGESSQEIGDIVGLITDIADQTNILALNAPPASSAC
jgi:twitching motility protein PilJ